MQTLATVIDLKLSTVRIRPGTDVIEHPRLQAAKPIRKPDDDAIAADRRGDRRDDLAQRENFRAAELVRLAGRCRGVECGDDRGGYVADEYRRKASIGLYERQHREAAYEIGEHARERVVGTENDRRLEDRVSQLIAGKALDSAFPGAFAAQVVAGPMLGVCL